MMKTQYHTYALPIELKQRLDQIRKELEQKATFKMKLTNANLIEFLVSRYEEEKQNG